MKNILLPLAILILPSSQLWAQAIDEKLRTLLHENKGCPINSICSKANGALMLEWERILELENIKSRTKQKSSFIKNNGIPLNFLSKKSISEKNDVILAASRCRVHNPKNPSNALYKGLMFAKSIPSIDGMLFDKVHVYGEKKVSTYTVPYEDKPIFMKENRLFFLEEFEDNFYQISIDKGGKLELEDLPQRLYGQAQSKKVKEVQCPKGKKEKEDYHHASYCQKIWDIDTNKMKTIQVFWSCP